MKKCVIIVNPTSGHGLNSKFKKKIDKIVRNYNYDVEVIFTKYHKHAENIIYKLSDDTELVISAGGDGTFSEVMNGNLKRDKQLTLAHLPIGTTNDIGHMYGLNKDLYTNLKLILEGTVKEIDVCIINDRAFTYVASYGKFMDIPYQTPQELKRKLGHFAYVLSAIKQAFTRIPKQEITFEIDGIKYSGRYTFIIISNANRIAGIDNFYNDIKLNDNKFEVMLCSLHNKIDILKAIYTLKTSDINQVAGIELYKVSEMRIKFKDKCKPWCVDGEKFEKSQKLYNIKIKNGIKMLVPNKSIAKLFVNN